MARARRIFNYIIYFFLPMAGFSAFNGVLIGALISLYGYMAEFLVGKSREIFGFVRNNLVYIPLLILGVVLLALIMTWLLKRSPECKGSGVPRAEGILRNILTFKWLRTLLTTFFATAITYFSGLSLGSEGPSIQLGVSIAEGGGKLFKTGREARTGFLTGGAAAGLSTAFNAPLTGIVFAIEEVHKKVSPMLLMSVGITVITSNIVTRLMRSALGIDMLLLDFGVLPEVPLSFAWALFLLGLTIGIFALIFNKLIFRANRSKFSKKLPLSVRLIAAFVISAALGLIFLDSVGGGHHMMLNIGNMKYETAMLALLLAVKLFLIILCFSSGASGGLFIPMLTLGALIGGLMAKLMIAAGLEPQYFTTIVVISMTAFFGASVRAPLTAIILVVEITGELSGFLMTAIAIFTAYFIPILARTAPLYDGLLQGIIANELPLQPPPYKPTPKLHSYYITNTGESVSVDEDDDVL